MAGLSTADQARVLDQFLRGALTVDQLRDRLRDHLTISHIEGGWRIDYHLPLDAEVVLTPNALLSVLNRYLVWDLDDDELAEWAALVSMIDGYRNPPDLTDEEADDLMDPVWTVLAEVSAPDLISMSLRERVERALFELAAAQARLLERAV